VAQDYFLHTVIKRLTDEAANVLQQLGDTPASDYVQYRGRVEYRKGLLKAVQLLKEESEK
jgi:hypothetical protein